MSQISNQLTTISYQLIIIAATLGAILGFTAYAVLRRRR